MLSVMEKQLNESQRDALVAGYIKFVGPGLNNAGGTTLTIEDLYEYLLLDPQVSDEVMTSRVASAIASIQEYMTRIVNGSEPGFQHVEPATVTSWRENESQYTVWAAGADIQNYAENYISPPTRLEKSHYFTALETTLNQNQLDPDRVQGAALAYLNQFEAVSNLYVVSGYVDQDQLPTATYYFIGRTTTKPYQYYWRIMDLSKNRQDYGRNPITPNCWSDWLPISLPLAADAVLDHTVRPVFYNRRLYVAWVERNGSPQKDADGKDTTQYLYQVKFGYKRFDDTWTAPNGTTLMTRQANESDETLRTALTINEPVGFSVLDVNLLATIDFSVEPGAESNPYGRLMLSVFLRDFSETGYVGENHPIIYGYQYCDSAFNSRELDTQIKNELFAIFKDTPTSKTNTLQYAIYKQAYVITDVEDYSGKGADGGDLHGSDPADADYPWWQKISELVATDSGTTSRVYMADDFTLRVEMTLNADFASDYEFTGDNITLAGDSGFGFGRLDGSAGVTIRYSAQDSYVFRNTALIYNPSTFGPPDKAPSDGAHMVWEANGGLFQWLNFRFKDNTLAWNDSGPYVKCLDLSGRTILDTDQSINNAIWSDVFSCSIDGVASVCGIENFSQLANTQKFACAIRFVTAQSDTTTSANSMVELDSATTSYTQDYPISEACFTENQTYVSVCLMVDYVHFNRPENQQTGKGTVWKWFKVYMKKADTETPANLPQIKSNYDASWGLVQYLDFCAADASTMPARTRLNTTFVRTLIDKASLGLDSLLDYDLQNRAWEASLDPGGPPEKMDFNGANGLYFWELFFHMPFLAGWRYSNEQQFDDARQWLHYIFDPALENKADGAPNYWNVRPLCESGQMAYVPGGPLDPDTLAYAHPVIYKKAVFLAYVSNIITQGDLWYRQLTRDGLTQARVFYNLAAELLGPRSDVTLSSTWTPQSVHDLASAQNSALRDFEQSIDGPTAGIVALPGERISYLQIADNQNFIAPLNTLLLSHWDTLDARLYNLRNNLTVDGKPMSLPLYAAPADPVALLTQRAQSGTLVSGISDVQLAVPPYRFNAILPRAYNAVATLSRFGDTLLSLIERGENGAKDELQQQQLLDMSSYALDLQKQTIIGLDADKQALLASKDAAKHRFDYYFGLALENISSTEQQVMDLHTSAQTMLGSSQDLQTASGALKMMPNIFGFSDGGSRYEGATEAVAKGMAIAARVKEVIADRLGTAEGYRRRQADWVNQASQAEDEWKVLDKQQNALFVRQIAAEIENWRLEAQQSQIQAMLTFTQKRFSQAALYQWLNGQLAALYYQLYDLVVSECLTAQACFQYELGDFSTTFIKTGAWNDHYRGLQVAESLQANLQKMEAAYLTRNERRLEITRTVSLVELLNTQTKNGSFSDQKAFGKFNFDLTESLYDNDYPGHYMRQIKSISISLPTLLGPYQDVKATLTQTKSSTLLNASATGAQYMNGSTQDPGDGKIVMNLRASQQLALSSGLNDAGLFEVNFGDERYLPFEGTGAVSSWTLAFPRYKTSATQQALLAALTDVIVHVRYTALDGGVTFATAVEGTLGS